jgi:hypothetical protein
MSGREPATEPLSEADVESLAQEPVVRDLASKYGSADWEHAVKENYSDQKGTGIGYNIPLGCEGVHLAFVRSSDAPDQALIMRTGSGEMSILTPSGGEIGSVRFTEDGVVVVEGDAEFDEPDHAAASRGQPS